jgi:hypothetical protein
MGAPPPSGARPPPRPFGALPPQAGGENGGIKTHQLRPVARLACNSGEKP